MLWRLVEGMSKEQQKDLQPKIDKLLGDIEGIVPGTGRETAKTQLSGAGKYDKPVCSELCFHWKRWWKKEKTRGSFWNKSKIRSWQRKSKNC